jgi:3' terminal RNA ribose 2'-O-methyltransferase Hen1
MLLTLTTTHRPATDLGFLLHKHPDRVQQFELPFGGAHVFYPVVSSERCTAALLLEVDPIGLVRGRRGKRGADAAALPTEYVNDRPYSASSFLSVAISRVFGSALKAQCKERPELVELEMPLTASVAALPCRGGVALLRRLFEPLGYAVAVEEPAQQEDDPDWTRGPHRNITLTARKRVADLLSHLYVLIPVLDDDKHYWVGDEEVEKLLRRGEGWLAAHPEKKLIARRYLKHRSHLAREALARLADEDDPDPDAATQRKESEEEQLEAPLRLNDVRMETVVQVLRDSGARRVLDLGCGEGRLLRELLRQKQFEEIAGLDASVRALEIASERLKLDRLAPRQRERIKLLHGALTYRDDRLAGYDAAAAVEVIEHLDPGRLAAFERVLFEFARPETVVVTTPNREYNAKFESLPAGAFRHRDHRFEWAREEFARWAERVTAAHGYRVEYAPVGEVDDELGAPSQMGVFRRCS